MRHSRMVRSIRLGIKNLLLHKLRSLLTVLGLVFGVGSVIAMLSVGEGASRQALDDIRKLGSNNIILQAVKPVAEERSAAGTTSYVARYGLLYDDERRIRESFSTVRRTVPAKTTPQDGRLGSRSLELRVVGTTPQWFQLVDRVLVAGRTLNWEDSRQHANVCVLTEHGARRLLATEHTIGQTLRIGRDYFEVVGIVRSETGSGGTQTPDLETDVYIPMTSARERYGDTIIRVESGSRQYENVELHYILVQVKSLEQVETTARAIETMLSRFHKKTDYRVRVPLALLKQAEASKRMFNIVLGAIASISLLVGGIGIMNIMLASVTERTREIGIRRAIGARQRQIITQFLVETVVLSTIGGLIGIIVGTGLPWGITYFTEMPTIITLWSVILSLGISVSVGIVFGLYPAVRASRLDPIVALRHE